MSDYYQLLGVPRNVSQEELKKAFREKALENHPDRISHLPEKERHQHEELMYLINDAYRTLSNPELRSAYDKRLREGRIRSTEGGSRKARSQASYEDLFSSIFGDSGIFESSIFRGSGSWGDYFGQPSKKKDYFTIPENDWGLLAALKKAYESKNDGRWRVKKTEDDKRRWVPDEIYTVVKEGNNVTVYRKIVDWRSRLDRHKNIVVTKEGGSLETREMKPNTFLGEFYLCGDGRNLLRESYNIPWGLADYLLALKSIARKLARKETDKDGQYEIAGEFEEMNRYGQFGSKNTRIEGQRIWSDDPDREWVKNVSSEDFWKRLSQAEKLVLQIEGIPKTKEGQPKTHQEKPSGESLG